MTNIKIKSIVLYILLISGIAPATYLFLINLFLIPLLIVDADFSLDSIATISLILLGNCGYVGLLMLLKGLYKSNHKTKIIFLGLGFIGLIFFFNYGRIKSFWEVILMNIKEFYSFFIFIWPIIISSFFLILTCINYKKSRLKTVGNNV